MVFVSGKLTGECGIVDTVNYKFKILLRQSKTLMKKRQDVFWQISS